MAQYIRDYHIRFLIEGNKTLDYTSVGQERPMHVKFKVGYGEKLSKLSLSIFNMSSESRKRIQSDDVKVRVQVGLRDTEKPGKIELKTLFLGSVNKDIFTTTSSADHETRITAAEGYSLKELKVNTSYPYGSSHTDVINDICKQTAEASGGMITYDSSGIDSLGITQKYKKGHTLSGVAEHLLDKLLITHNLKFKVAQGTLRITKQGRTPLSRIHKFNIQSGLLTAPKPIAQKNAQAQSNPLPTKGYRFKTILSPEVIPESWVEVTDPITNEVLTLIVEKVRHTGAYEANEWYTEIEATLEAAEIQSNVIAENKTKSTGINYKSQFEGQ